MATSKPTYQLPPDGAYGKVDRHLVELLPETDATARFGRCQEIVGSTGQDHESGTFPQVMAAYWQFPAWGGWGSNPRPADY